MDDEKYKCAKCGGDIRSTWFAAQASEAWLAAALSLHEAVCNGELKGKQ